jgi:hypothetical protein
MQVKNLCKAEWLTLGVMLGVLVALLAPTTQSAWDGHFQLTIAVDQNVPVDRDSLLFATFWFEHEARQAIKSPGVYEWGFHPPSFNAAGHAVIDVPASGRPGNWGTSGSYNHPQILVAEYCPADAEGPPTRRRFDIPGGRGARFMRIDLPWE